MGDLRAPFLDKELKIKDLRRTEYLENEEVSVVKVVRLGTKVGT